MAFVKIKKGVVVQKQPYFEKGFIEAPDDVVCGFIANGDGTYTAPEPTPKQRPSDFRLAQHLVMKEALARVNQMTDKEKDDLIAELSGDE